MPLRPKARIGTKILKEQSSPHNRQETGMRCMGCQGLCSPARTADNKQVMRCGTCGREYLRAAMDRSS